jgi:MarR-like DNA-binding transcriptional regulator SgrR of sgrS sRNA
MLILDSQEVEYCQLIGQAQGNTETGLIYNGKTFVRQKTFPREELEIAIKECRENYLDHEKRSQIPTLLVKENATVGIWMHENGYKPDYSQTIIPPSLATQTTQDNKNLSVKQLAEKMRAENGVTIKTRRYKLKFYHRCFLGNEAVDWIVAQTNFSRDRAIQLGQKMMDKKLFHHIVDEHNFKDEPLFYRFYEDEGKSIWTDKI